MERYAEYKDSGVDWIGDIPSKWELRRIKNLISSHQVGAWGDEPQEDENDRICIRVADFDFDRLTIYSEDYTIRNYSPAQIRKLTLKPGDILIEKSGGGEKLPVGRVVMYNEAFPALYANFLEAIHPTEEVCNRYMGYALASAYHWGVNRKYYNQTTGIQNLNMPGYTCEKIGLPSLREQTVIACYLDRRTAEIDTLLADLAYQAEMLDRYKRQIIAEAVTKRLDKSVAMKDSGVDYIGDIPAHWNTCRIKYLYELRQERNFLPLEEVELISLYTDLGVVKHSDLEKTTGNKAHNADGYKHVYKNDIVVNIILCWMGAVGLSDYDGVTSPAYDVYKPNSNLVCSKYYHYLFRTQKFNGECFKVGRGIMMMRWRTYSD